jgi:hypothetical protein
MLSFRLRQSQNCLAGRTFAVDVSFAVAEFVSFKSEKIAEFLIFRAPFCNIARHRSEEDVAHERE